MGRKKVDPDKIKVNTKIRIRKDLKELAMKKNINFSQLMEENLIKILKIDEKED